MASLWRAGGLGQALIYDVLHNNCALICRAIR